jgi:hypothetical protein
VILQAPSRVLLVTLTAVSMTFGAVACGNSENATPAPPSESATGSVSEEAAPPKEIKFSVRNGAVKGYVDSSKVEGGAVLLTGWAASSNLSNAAKGIVARVGGKRVAEAVPTVERADVAAYYGKPALKHSGFLLQVPVSSLECSSPAAGVHVFGVIGTSGSALKMVEGSAAGLTAAC